MFHRKCRDKLLWLQLLRRLDVIEAPDLPPGEQIRCLTALDLRRKVIGAVKASYDWRNKGHISVSRSAELRVRPADEVDPDKGVKPRLLPGGREVLMENCGRLELWSMVSKERLWASPVCQDRDCITFEFQLSDDQKTLNIVDVFATGGV